VTRLTARIGVWPTAIVISIALALAVNLFATIGFLSLDQPSYSERPFGGALIFIVPFIVGVPISLLLIGALNRARIAEIRARDNEAKFRDLAEGSVQGICIQRNFVPFYCNQAFATMFGFASPEEILAFGEMSRLIPTSTRDAVVARSHEIRRPGKSRTVIHPALKVDGTEIWVETHIRHVLWDGEDALQLTAVDVSERRKIDEMKNDFISTVSHELRTPLTSIKGALGLLESEMIGGLPERVRDVVKIAATNSDRLVRLINDILDIERIEAGVIKFQPEALDIMPLMRQAVDQEIGFAQTEGVSLLVTDANLEIGVVGDRDQLLQVLGNLISNAIKFSPRENEVLLSAIPHGAVVRVSVTDQGAGIPEAFKPRIFEKFSQADASPARHHKGTGLGLHISKLIVERHGGEIGFESVEGGGTMFYFDLPAPIASAEPGQLAAE
jgi:PAS domain S-box-containing protein